MAAPVSCFRIGEKSGIGLELVTKPATIRYLYHSATTATKRGRKCLRDDERSGRPNTATTDENIAKVHQMVLHDHRIKDCHGVISIDYLQKRKTITGAYYASSLDKLKAELAEKQLHFQEKKILFHQETHRLTRQRLPWRKSTNCGLN
ncbi:hypothetical protein TNCV_3490561 [Trichonephila clavipes]|nr:hypothetical protein TNCV_3490561 [Trichonephila clavipes]